MTPDELLKAAEDAIAAGREFVYLSRASMADEEVGQIRRWAGFKVKVVRIKEGRTSIRVEARVLQQIAQRKIHAARLAVQRAERAARPKHSWESLRDSMGLKHQRCRKCGLEKHTETFADGGPPRIWWTWREQVALPFGRELSAPTPSCPPVVSGSKAWGFDTAWILE